MPQFLITEEVAKVLRLHPDTVRIMARQGRIASCRLPGSQRLLFPADQFKDLADSSGQVESRARC